MSGDAREEPEPQRRDILGSGNVPTIQAQREPRRRSAAALRKPCRLVAQ